MKTFGKILLWCLSAVFAAALIAAVVIGVKYYRVTHSAAKVELVSGPSLDKEVQPELGEKRTIGTVFRVPWGIHPMSMSVQPAPGSQLTAPPVFTRVKRGWGSDLWESRILLQCYREGSIGSAPAEAVFSNRQTIDLKLPALQVTAPKLTGNQLELAGEADVTKQQKNHRMIWLTVFLGLLAAAVIILTVLRFLKKERTRIVPPWEKALSSIQSLLEQVRAGTAHPEKSIARLTDIVRDYMEQRFHLRAERQTTAEFMADLERGKGILSEGHRNFLRNFLTAADMVKFARVSADRRLFEDAAEKAAELIRATTPAAPGKEKR